MKEYIVHFIDVYGVSHYVVVFAMDKSSANQNIYSEYSELVWYIVETDEINGE